MCFSVLLSLILLPYPLSVIDLSSNLLHCWISIYQLTFFLFPLLPWCLLFLKYFYFIFIFKSETTFVCFCSLWFSNQSPGLYTSLWGPQQSYPVDFNKWVFYLGFRDTWSLKFFFSLSLYFGDFWFPVGSGVSVPGLMNFNYRSSMQPELLQLSKQYRVFLFSLKWSHFVILHKYLRDIWVWSREVFVPTWPHLGF